MRHRLAFCQALVLESNHDIDMLQNGNYPPYLKQRIRSSQGHLDNRETAVFLRELVHEELQHVVLAHLSEENNHPEVAFHAAVEALNINPLWQEQAIRITVACQGSVGELVSLAGK